MRILNFGSLNIDHVYRVTHIVRPGETLAGSSYQVFAGGKGANQSVALARAGADVVHAGRVGTDGRWLIDKLATAGVDTRLVEIDDQPTGHAIIQVDDAGQNAIVLFPGANRRITATQIDRALATFASGDLLLLQNEINDVPCLIRAARARGIGVASNPAPFSPEVFDYPLDQVNLLVVNQTECRGLVRPGSDEELIQALAAKLPAAELVLTLGERGAVYHGGGEHHEVPGLPVRAADTTAAGDTFIGYYLAWRAAEHSTLESLQVANRAASICVSRPGAMDSIPCRAEVVA